MVIRNASIAMTAIVAASALLEDTQPRIATFKENPAVDFGAIESHLETQYQQDEGGPAADAWLGPREDTTEDWGVQPWNGASLGCPL